MYYPNLKAEMARQRITIKGLAELVGMPQMTMYKKVKCVHDFTYQESVRVKEALQVDIPLEELFQKED